MTFTDPTSLAFFTASSGRATITPAMTATGTASPRHQRQSLHDHHRVGVRDGDRQLHVSPADAATETADATTETADAATDTNVSDAGEYRADRPASSKDAAHPDL